jgi:hypothetical protein
MPYNGKLPKTLEQLRPQIVDFEDDRGDNNGYFVHLIAGLINTFDEVHFLHEDTLKLIHNKFKNNVKPCQCEECLRYLNYK